MDDAIDFPVSPAWAAHYARLGLTPALPEVFPLSAPRAAWWDAYDPLKADIGENSPLWAGLATLYPQWALERKREKDKEQKQARQAEHRRQEQARQQLERDHTNDLHRGGW